MSRAAFRADDDGAVTVRLPSWLRRLLAEQLADLDRLLADNDPTTAPAGGDPADGAGDPAGVGADPLAAITGLTGADGSPPEDPVLRRLRPAGYAEDADPEASREFRRFTEADLAAVQRARIATVRETVLAGDRVQLDPEQAQAWLGALNDLRLALGTRLGVSEDLAAEPGPEHPLAGSYELYHLLGALQHQLLVALGAPDEF
jgi:hypothetical protein